jgi:hypothetical protein
MLAILPLAKIGLGRTARAAMANLPVDLASRVVFAEVVVGDHQIQLRFGVIRIQAHRLFEVPFGLIEIALGVRDHPEHVENIRESIGFGHDLPQQVLGLVELALLVVLPAQEQQLLDVVVHALRMEPRNLPQSTEVGARPRLLSGKKAASRDLSIIGVRQIGRLAELAHATGPAPAVGGAPV